VDATWLNFVCGMDHATSYRVVKAAAGSDADALRMNNLPGTRDINVRRFRIR
jgi:hypothetical protein